MSTIDQTIIDQDNDADKETIQIESIDENESIDRSI